MTRRDVFQGIADPTRRMILALLALQAMTPNALAERFDSTRQAVSKHVGILTECGLVTQQHQGREIYYHLNTNKMKEVDAWLEPFRKMWDDKFNELENVLNNLKNKNQ
ncbi:winged helix-turn-helix transcriptional regulator [Mucilaginibacter mali]|uniref:Winged helix-turn-helix transcriptional regulator n=1 Tax=Mucilaginibacter mali TaxID=2740462 RepID=A0A7D4QPZ8_9SPHI|nr:metalloregulator ArsR/SmtB family transcription factor [Mucilaginibacter mali]QKJ28849.1 winged helix-turn-helix transcriptional regulator [Mucilaginibacter mali]